MSERIPDLTDYALRARVTRTVTLPERTDHSGFFSTTKTLEWVCPRPGCGRRRGEPTPGLSWDGSRRLAVDEWRNPCGHVDFYDSVREETIPERRSLNLVLVAGHPAVIVCEEGDEAVRRWVRKSALDSAHGVVFGVSGDCYDDGDVGLLTDWFTSRWSSVLANNLENARRFPWGVDELADLVGCVQGSVNDAWLAIRERNIEAS